MKNHKLLVSLPLLLTISTFSLADSEQSIDNTSLQETSDNSGNTIFPLQCNPFPECKKTEETTLLGLIIEKQTELLDLDKEAK